MGMEDNGAKSSADVKLEAAFSDTPAAEPSAPAAAEPAAAPVAVAGAGTAASQTPAQQAPQAAPTPAQVAEGGTPLSGPGGSIPVAPQQVPDQMQTYIRELQQQNMALQQNFQAALENQNKLLARSLEKAAPQLTPEELAKAQAEAFQELNTDPQGFVQKRVQAALDEALKKQAADFETRLGQTTAPIQREQFMQTQFVRLAQAPNGSVVRPELLNPAFQNLMKSPEVVGEVLSQNYAPNADVDSIFKTSDFWTHLYYSAKAKAGAGFAPQLQASANDLAAQAAFASNGGASPGTGARTAGPAGTPQVSPEKQAANEIVAAPLHQASDLMQNAKWT